MPPTEAARPKPDAIRVQHDPLGIYDPQGIVASPDGTKVYVVYAAFLDPSGDDPVFQTSTVSTIDTATNEVVASVTLPDYNLSITISPDGKTLYLAAFDFCGCASEMNSAFIDVVDTVSNSLVSEIYFPEPPVDGNPVVVAVIISFMAQSYLPTTQDCTATTPITT